MVKTATKQSVRFHVLPIPMHVRGTKGVAVMKQRWVNHDARLSLVKQVEQIVQMSITSTYAISKTVLVQDKQLPRWEPPLEDGRYKGW